MFEDGVKQNITFFSRRQQPIAMSLLLDSSASMEQHLGTLQTAATNFIKKLKPNDIAQVIDFDSRVEIRQGFTAIRPSSRPLSSRPTPADRPRCTTRSTSRSRSFGRSRPSARKMCAGRRSLSSPTARTPSSLVSFEEVLDLAKRSETAIYAIALRGNDVQAKGFREAEFVMRTLAQETGGRAFFPARIEDLTRVYAQIADELASQHTLGYTSGNQRRDGAWRRLVVQVREPTSRRAPRRATTPDGPLNAIPLVLRRRRGCLCGAFREATTGRRPYGDDSAAPRRARTPSSSACRRWRCGTCRSRAARTPSPRSCGCWRCRTSISS